MKFPARMIVSLLPFLLAGCAHKPATQAQPLAPPIVDTPPPKPAPPTDLPPPVITVPTPPPPAVDTTTQTEPEPKPPVKHKKPAATPSDQADNEPSSVPAIGTLSSGDPTDKRQQASDSIAATERGLTGITRTLSDQEQKTAAQIREFLKQAREALVTGDVDGASTLAAKAKVLLSELTQ
jgi:outer membrane biosynthesis protein TonB